MCSFYNAFARVRRHIFARTAACCLLAFGGGGAPIVFVLLVRRRLSVELDRSRFGR